MLKYIFVFCLSFVWMSSCSSPSKKQIIKRAPELEFSYQRLKLLDLEEMTALIDERLEKYRQTNDIKAAQEALLITLSRPNDDNLSGRMMSGLKVTLGSEEVWQRILKNIIDQSIAALKNPVTAATDQVTYIFVLQTWLSEIKPETARPQADIKFELVLLKAVADAQLKVSEEADKETRLNLMMQLQSPSLIAQEIWQSYQDRINPQPRSK